MRAHVPAVGQQRHRAVPPAGHDLEHHGDRREDQHPQRAALGQRIGRVEAAGVRRNATATIFGHHESPARVRRPEVGLHELNPYTARHYKPARSASHASSGPHPTFWLYPRVRDALGHARAAGGAWRWSTFLAAASRGLLAPLSQLDATPLSLAPSHLPEYAARTTLRMFAALALSLVFTLTYATWAAKSPRAGRFLVPLLDILQSVPILGFISITVVFFMALVPGRVLGAEFAAIFAIFTSQAWNMAFSFYQSLRTVPTELAEAAASFHLTPWMRFWQLEVPFALPALTWNMMMSMSGGWFFVVASESISVGHTHVALPGIGSYIALAIEQRNLHAIGWAITTMAPGHPGV